MPPSLTLLTPTPDLLYFQLPHHRIKSKISVNLRHLLFVSAYTKVHTGAERNPSHLKPSARMEGTVGQTES